MTRYVPDATAHRTANTPAITRYGSTAVSCAATSGTNTSRFFTHWWGRNARRTSRGAPEAPGSSRASGSRARTSRARRAGRPTPTMRRARLHTARSRRSFPTLSKPPSPKRSTRARALAAPARLVRPSEARKPAAPTLSANGATTVSSAAEASQTSRPCSFALAISSSTARFRASVSGGSAAARATRRLKAARPPASQTGSAGSFRGAHGEHARDALDQQVSADQGAVDVHDQGREAIAGRGIARGVVDQRHGHRRVLSQTLMIRCRPTPRHESRPGARSGLPGARASCPPGPQARSGRPAEGPRLSVRARCPRTREQPFPSALPQQGGVVRGMGRDMPQAAGRAQRRSFTRRCRLRAISTLVIHTCASAVPVPAAETRERNASPVSQRPGRLSPTTISRSPESSSRPSRAAREGRRAA